jgi:hypothetical protein
MKTLRCRQYSLKQKTQFKILNKEQDHFDFNINDSLTQDSLHLPFPCMGQFGTKVMFLSHETLRAWHYNPKEQIQPTILKKVLDPLVSNINDFLRKPMVLLHGLERGNFAQS